MRNFIGNTLIVLADIISTLYRMLTLLIIVGIFMGLMFATMIAFFSIFNYATPYGPLFDGWVIDKWYWNLLIFLFGSSVFLLTMKRLLFGDIDKKY